MLEKTRCGYALQQRLGPLSIEAWYERPPQSWKRFQAELSVTLYDE